MKNNKFNYSSLEGKIKEYYDTQSNFAKAIPMSRSSLNQKINNKINFTSNDIKRISELLNIKVSDIGNYFFSINNNSKKNIAKKGKL